MHFLEQIMAWARSDPEKLAIIYEQDALTFSQLARNVAIAQEKFATEGLTKGQMVALAIQNPLQRMPALLALLGMGVTTVNCNETSTLPAVTLGATTFISGRTLSLPRNCRQIVVDAAWYSGEPAALAVTRADFGGGDAATVWFSSGSTGYPRALALTWATIAHRIAKIQWWHKFAAYERAAILPHLVSPAGCQPALAFLASGSSIVILDNAEDAIATAELLAFDYIVMSSAQMIAIINLARAKQYQFHRLRGGWFAGAEVSDALIRDALTYLCRDLCVAYGASEIGTISIQKCAHVVGRSNCVGIPDHFATVRVVDENMNDVATGAEGEIIVQGPDACIPNWGQEPAYGQSSDLWVRPGDRGYFNAEGELFITGRTSDVINIGGNKIAPDRLESQLCTHPDIKDAAALGVMSDAHGIARLHVFIVAPNELTRGALLAWWAERTTGLTLDEIEFVDAIPRTDSGKIARYKLTELVQSRPA